MAEDTQKDRSYLINFALRMLCEAGGPDGLFQQKTKAIMMESLGFDTIEGLLDIIDARIAAQSDSVPQPGMLPDPLQESPRDVPPQHDPINAALEFIRIELWRGTAPMLDEVAAQVGMEKDKLSLVLATMGVKTTRIRKDGKRRQYYLKDQLPAVLSAQGLE